MSFAVQTGCLSLAFFCAVVLLLPSAAIGQAGQESPTGDSQTQAATTMRATPPTVSRFTLKEPELRPKQAQDAAGLAEDVKTEAVNFRAQAHQQLQMARQWAISAAEFEAERQEVPQTLHSIQQELATPLAAPPESRAPHWLGVGSAGRAGESAAFTTYRRRFTSRQNQADATAIHGRASASGL
jgi:hypothetical protein